MSEHIPSDVEELLRRHIHSVMELEVLIFLRRQAAAHDAETVAHALYIAAGGAAVILEALRDRGFLQTTSENSGLYQYGPQPPSLDQTIGRLEHLYATRRLSVMHLIFAEPPPTPAEPPERNQTLRLFSDAFKLRREE